MDIINSVSENIFNIPDVDNLYECAYKNINLLPSNIKNKIDNLLISVENFASQDVLQELNIDNKYDLLGFYKGFTLNCNDIKKTKNKCANIIYLYRCPLIKFSKQSNEDIFIILRQVLFNEISQNFGFSIEEIEKNSCI